MVATVEQISHIVGNAKMKELKPLPNIVKDTVDSGISAEEILNSGILKGMEIVGEKFKNEVLYLPEVMLTAKIVKECINILKPHLSQNDSSSAGKICIGTVEGDNHDIGKNIVKIMLESKGFEVIYLGTNVPASSFVDTAIEKECCIIALSALLTTTMPKMEEVITLLKETGKNIKIMVGGAPVTEEFARQIGADAYAKDAAEAAAVASSLVAK
jgi:corrinoid protein of di/trimethylamine methyltransferase